MLIESGIFAGWIDAGGREGRSKDQKRAVLTASTACVGRASCGAATEREKDSAAVASIDGSKGGGSYARTRHCEGPKEAKRKHGDKVACP